VIPMGKIIKLLNKLVEKLTPAHASMKYIVWYALMLVFSSVIYLIAWLFKWYIEGKPDLPSLLAFIHEIASAAWIAVIGFCAKYFIDRNADGIPDELEGKGGDHCVR